MKKIQLLRNYKDGVRWARWESYIILLYTSKQVYSGLRSFEPSVEEGWLGKTIALIGIYGMKCWIGHCVVSK